ncbi:MAG: GNAT family N-acetyltransferase [Devosia sp.]|uniref:GNAT family N-acetyltransferase n=1 Tax=Devosia sp. TaxID=1871048 RepID=UPI001A5B275D|nr:GNAT family N-acetyltransferase [Devosia sp.]MBL8596550.1 GNAT family N-acetyltransferase [Devosia sp.]
MSGIDLFETERLVLSGWRREQLPDLVRLHGDPVVARYLSTHGQPWTIEAMEAALDEWIALFATRRLGKLRVTRKADGVLVGRCGFGIYEPTGEPELGYSLYPEFWGNGYAVEAGAGMRDWFFRETEMPQFIGLADVRNAASIKVLERIGMTPTEVKPYDGVPFQFYVMARPQ